MGASKAHLMPCLYWKPCPYQIESPTFASKEDFLGRFGKNLEETSLMFEEK